MKEKLVKRFYCDHCGKGRFHRKAMAAHEDKCIYNPARICPLCVISDIPQSPMDDLILGFHASDSEGLDKLRFMANNCPACILSAIVQGRRKVTVQVDNDRDVEMDEWVNFNYKDEMKDWYAMQSDKTPNTPSLCPF